MCRSIRIKYDGAIFHVMARSGSDSILYRDSSDKDKFLMLVKKYQEKFIFKIHAYCIMNTHYHLLIDPNGADLSKIMHCINQSYAQYYNSKYQRRGHVFQDRFRSKIINSNNYLINVSSYIHNNPSDINEYKNKVEKYKYSSLGIYLGINNDKLNLVDSSIILNQFNNNSIKYLDFINSTQKGLSKVLTELENESKTYRSEKNILKRNLNPQFIIDYVSNYCGINKQQLNFKSNNESTLFRGICIALIYSFSNVNYREICELIGNATLSAISKLSSIGHNALINDSKYKNLIPQLLTCQ